jgi:uncharacterized membrane protein YfcA
MAYEFALLFGAGFLGGILNSLAGGGTFLTFPALLVAEVPPVAANATNTFASCAGYLGGAYALRRELLLYRHQLPRLIGTSLLGGVVGAWLLLQTPERVFRDAIPWLLLFATLLFVFGADLNRRLRRLATVHRRAPAIGLVGLQLLLLAVCVYGGFFNAGLGIITLSYLALAGHSDINAMNGLKLLISATVASIAIIVFAAQGAIAWYAGSVVLLGTLLGGSVAAHASRRIPQRHVRTVVIMAASAITLYFFVDVYGTPPTRPP